jgi:hypothetical protein
MKVLRVMLAVLAIIPLAMLVDSLLFHPDSYGEGTVGELLFPLFGVPILMFNLWAWLQPEMIEYYFFGKEIEKD